MTGSRPLTICRRGLHALDEPLDDGQPGRLTNGSCRLCHRMRRSQRPITEAARETRRARDRQRLASNPARRAKRDESARRYRQRHPLYETWKGIKQRTTNPRKKAWPDYGARGITMAPDWLASFSAFESWVLTNLGPRPDGMSLDRIDNDGHYEPGNVRWADRRTQRLNRRRAA